ncbi:hypothetical protein WDW37_18650 [Bdellovibrionota bacterium FG-1]
MLSTSAYSESASAAKAFNPDVSVNFLSYVRRSNVNSGDLIGRTSDVHNGFTFQEAEMQFFADVDPYFRANALFALAPDPAGGFSLDPEEVFLETIALSGFTVRAGKFKAALGKHNTLHTHAYPFIDAPLISQDLVGGEGLNEAGVSVSALLPTPWFMELTGQVMNNNNEALYNSPNAGDVSGIVQLKNLWDLSDDLTMEWSVFGTQGKNQASLSARVGGSDIIFKWRPAEGGKYHALIFANEYLYGDSPTTGFNVGPSDARLNGEQLGGLASWIQYQFAERWWVQGRVEFEGLQRTGNLPSRQKQSALLGFFPSEFSGFRMQYDHILAANQPEEHAVTLQLNVIIGAHPAHSY